MMDNWQWYLQFLLGLNKIRIPYNKKIPSYEEKHTDQP